MLLSELLKFIPADTEQRVRRARDRFNTNIREAIRQETGLRFRPKAKAGDLQPTEAISVPIRIVPGLPESLQRREIENEHRTAAILAPWKEMFRQLKESALTSHELIWGGIAPDEPPNIQVHLGLAAEFATNMLRQIEGFGLITWILEVNEDVLGCYRFYVTRRDHHTLFREFQDPCIELFWAVIGLISRVIGIGVEELTVVVLAHELAHAYTHRASDIDGKVWDSDGFADSNHALKEGLAQYYTAQACERLSSPLPGASAAYRALLPFQPEAYQSHTPWLKDFKPEEVRFALVAARRQGAIEFQEFESILKNVREDLRSRKNRRAGREGISERGTGI